MKYRPKYILGRKNKGSEEGKGAEPMAGRQILKCLHHWQSCRQQKLDAFTTTLANILPHYISINQVSYFLDEKLSDVSSHYWQLTIRYYRASLRKLDHKDELREFLTFTAA